MVAAVITCTAHHHCRAQESDTTVTRLHLNVNAKRPQAEIAYDVTPIVSDSIRHIETPPLQKKNLIGRIIQYFDEANKTSPLEKQLPIFTFVGGPSYSQSTSLQLAVMAAGLYRSRMDSVHSGVETQAYSHRALSRVSTVLACQESTTALPTDTV